MRTKFDELGKQIIGAAIEPGGEVAREHRVLVPGMSADIWFRPDPGRAAAPGATSGRWLPRSSGAT